MHLIVDNCVNWHDFSIKHIENYTLKGFLMRNFDPLLKRYFLGNLKKTQNSLNITQYYLDIHHNDELKILMLQNIGCSQREMERSKAASRETSRSVFEAADPFHHHRG